MRGDRSACPPAPGRDSHLILSVLRLGGLTLKTSFGFGLTLSLLSLVSCSFFFSHKDFYNYLGEDGYPCM